MYTSVYITLKNVFMSAVVVNSLGYLSVQGGGE